MQDLSVSRRIARADVTRDIRGIPSHATSSPFLVEPLLEPRNRTDDLLITSEPLCRLS